MAVLNLIADSNARGGQIDLTWTNPPLGTFAGVKVIRRESTFPDLQNVAGEHQLLDDASLAPTEQFSDTGLKGETVYYYAVVTYDGGGLSPPAFASAMATSAYDSGATLYDTLPAIYSRFDTVFPPPGVAPGDEKKGQLHRFLEMFGMQLDLLRSFTAGMRSFSDVDRIDGALLPLLAQWIGWQTDSTVSLAVQRNEIAYAPHYHRTTGLAGNLRATINRYTTFDARIKEFVHNVFLSNDPAQLTIWEAERQSGAWRPAHVVTLDLAHEGKPAALQTADGRQWLVYHARQNVPSSAASAGRAATASEWHLHYKIRDHGAWQPARRLSYGGEVDKYPTALQRSNGNLWLFWSRFEDIGGEHQGRIQLSVLALGRPARTARLAGTQAGPWAFVEGDQFRITAPVARVVTFHDEDFVDPTNATPAEVVAVLNRELPGVEASAGTDDRIILTSLATGSTATISLPPSTVAIRLGLTGPATGTNAIAADVKGERIAPFALADEDSLTLVIDGKPFATITFAAADFVDITQATALDVANVINRALPGLARVDVNKIALTSPATGEQSLIAVSVNESSAAAKLGLGTPPPPATPAAADTEPAACEDASGNVWLFWSSRRSGTWKIWYNRFDGTTWGSAEPLTAGAQSDREPAVLFDPSAGGRLWVFWSRQNTSGLRNIFFRTTTNLNFPVPAWTEIELTAPPPDTENREPAPVLLGPDSLELYFSSNRTDGWHIWSKTLTSTTQGPDVQVGPGQFTHRAAAVLQLDPQTTHLWFRSNESLTYTSKFYPASTTIDGRYSGSTASDTANAAKIALRNVLEDSQHYTYDARNEDTSFYARNTVGIYLAANGAGVPIVPNVARIRDIVQRFLPIQVRALLIL